MSLDKRYLFVAAALALMIFGVSVSLYPEWQGAWWLLIVAVVVGVVGFIANFRQAFEKKKGEIDMNTVPEKETERGNQPGSINIEGSSAGGDIMASTGGEINKIGTQINNPTININSQTVFRPGSAPPRPSLMIGRDDDVKVLKERLSITAEGKTSLQVLTAIKGWPGVGKTTIASALAYDPEIAKLFPDGVLWTSLGQEPNILSEMATWGRALGTDEILKAKSVEEAQNLLAGLLRNKRMLLIVDDVWKAEDAFPFRVGGLGCATLITTRLDGIANALAPVADNIYRLKVLKDDDALELLRQLAPSVVKQHPGECLVLVQELEGLPLALQVAGRLLNTEANYGFGVIELIDNLRQGAKLLEATAPADRTDLVTETTPTIAALLQKSLDRLDETTKERYAYLGVFAPKPATFDMDAMKFVWQMEDPKSVIKALVDRGLLEFVPELGRYQMHALLVMLAKTLLTDDE
jgi:general stress protein CsbA